MTNIEKLLKDCPRGTKLYSPLFGEVEFVKIDKQSGYPIDVTDCKGNSKSFTEFGVYFADHPDAECLLFPSKEVRTWEGWEAPVEPKFKVGDKISWINHDCDTQTITDIRDGSYITVDKYGVRCALKFAKQDEWELVPPKPHYNITNFKPFDKVLVRCRDGWNWECNLFSRYEHRLKNPFITCNSSYLQCIPFEGNEHLLGTTDMPSEEYINW